MYALVRFAALALSGGVFLLSGCASSGSHKFEPVPVGKIGSRDIEPVQPRGTEDLLRAANEHFDAANLAQSQNDYEGALRHYTLMLELLIEADLDPTVYYQLRSELARILDKSAVDAESLPRIIPPREWVNDTLPLAARSELEWPNPLNQRVLDEIAQIQGSYPKSFQRGLDRAPKYLPYIVQEFRKAGLPVDLAWLAMVESQFTPKIDSRADAGGMWQFMRGTGRRYELEIDNYVDERYDWKRSTAAAVRYLTELYEMFDKSWPLAISAYNKGEYGMEKAVAANGGTRNLWQLIESPAPGSELPVETQKFYPKLLASIVVAKNPEQFGFRRDPQPGDNTASIEVSGAVSLAALEKTAGYPRDTLKHLNPQLLRGATPSGRTSRIWVPAGDEVRVASALTEAPKVRQATHVVRRGETPSAIAARYAVDVDELIQTNDIKNANSLRVGQRLEIPGGGTLPEPELEAGSAAAGESVAMAKAAKPSKTYMVRRGDSLSSIAARQSASVSDLQKWNGMGRSTQIHAGQKLRVGPSEGAADRAPEGEPVIHVVQSGEAPSSIAGKYGVAVDDFLHWNNLSVRSVIRVGQKLKVYRTAPAPAPGTTEPVQVAEAAPKEQTAQEQASEIHVVQRGDTMSTIAKKYGIKTTELLAWNHLDTQSVLHVGQEIALHGDGDAAGQAVTLAKAAPENKRIEHTVAKGQNPSTIAQQYGIEVDDLFEWNGWKKGPVLHVGDKVVVFAD